MNSEDFKSFCRALKPSGVGSIPTRSRHFLAGGVTLLALCAGVPAAAQEPPPAAPRVFRPSPGGAMLRSALVPGWGQLYNRRLVKAVLFAAGRGYLGYRIFREQDIADGYERAAQRITDDPGLRDQTWRARNRALDRRDDFIWWSAFALVFTMAEAYVDAALMGFDEEFEGADDIPDDAITMRVGYRISF